MTATNTEMIMDKRSIIRVFSYEPGTKVTKQKRTLEFPMSKKDDRQLEVIRKLLIDRKVLGALDVRNPFCDAAGAEVSDQMTISVYLDQLVEDVQEGVESETQTKDGEEAAAKPKEEETPKFYYKKSKVQTKTDNATQEFLKKKLDLKLRSNPTLSPMRAQLLQSAFQSDKWTAAPAAKLSVVAELSERDWSMIARTNCLLSGQRLTYSGDFKDSTVERTPFNAFKIKSRTFDSYEIVAPTGQKNQAIGDIEAHIPRFRVDDSSYVNVIETQNGLQASMAKSSFSQSSIEASAGGGFWGVSAAAKGGVATRKGDSEITTNSEEQKQMHVIYSFPRVTVYLDADSLELTDEVKRDIAEVKRLKTKDSVKMFGDKYGHIFSRRVKLGGRLISSHQSTATTADKKAESENSLKAAAAVSVSGYGFSASAEASHETGGRSNTSETQQDFANNMAWEATGGNTVLCNNPPEWCGTVGNFRNWRIVEQSDIIPLTKFISTFDGYESLEHDFHEIAGTYKLQIGADVYYKVQLIDVETNNRLIAGPKDGVNPLKKAIIKVGGRLGHEPKIQKLLHDALEDSKAGSVKFQDKDSEQDTGSFWVLERTFPAGDIPELRCDIGYFITNEVMPDDRKHLGLLHPTSTSDPDFLYPSTEANRGYFLLRRPKGDQRKGPIESGDTVVLEVWNANKTRTMGYVMRGKINKNDKPTANDINQVLSVAPKTHDATDNSDRIVEFRVEIDHFWHRPRP